MSCTCTRGCWRVEMVLQGSDRWLASVSRGVHEVPCWDSRWWGREPMGEGINIIQTDLFFPASMTLPCRLDLGLPLCTSASTPDRRFGVHMSSKDGRHSRKLCTQRCCRCTRRPRARLLVCTHRRLRGENTSARMSVHAMTCDSECRDATPRLVPTARDLGARAAYAPSCSAQPFADLSPGCARRRRSFAATSECLCL